MNRVESLLNNYSKQVALPWEKGLAGSQKVWFAVYHKEDELRVRAHIPEFKLATERCGHRWLELDITNAFSDWMLENEFMEDYFKEPEYLDGNALGAFQGCICELIKKRVADENADDNTVIVLLGTGALFGLAKVSQVVKEIEETLTGRLLVFFPGTFSGNNYRLLDARDGWNYLAIPILSDYSEI